MSSNKNVDDPHAILQKELGDAYDFDPADPMAGLTTADMTNANPCEFCYPPSGISSFPYLPGG